jgi:G3E family GTPase
VRLLIRFLTLDAGEVPMRLNARIRIHILTGFLGSGKSTLLRRFLSVQAMPARYAIVINEFGAVSVDHALVRTYAKHSSSLSGGCACCNSDEGFKTFLLETLQQILHGDLQGVEDVIFETSGISDPSRILGTLTSEMHLAEYFEFKSCVTVLESGTESGFLERFSEARNQIACANRIVITKTDLVDTQATQNTLRLAQMVNPIAQVDVIDEHFAVGSLFDTTFQPRIPTPLPREHAAGFSTSIVETDRDLTWPDFSVWLTAVLHCHGERILRFKGLIALPHSTQQILVLQGVRHRVYPPEHLDVDPAEPLPALGLVFICSEDMGVKIGQSLRNFTRAVRAK